MNIDCCKSYVGKQIIGLLPGGAEECLYVLAINAQDYGDTNFIGWTLNGNDFLTEIQNYVDFGTDYNNDQGSKSYYGYYTGTTPTDLNITTNISGEVLFTIRKVTDYEGASCDLVCYQASFDYGFEWRFIDFFSAAPASPYNSPSGYNIDDATNLQYFASGFLGSQITVTSVWNGSQYVVTINNAFNLGGFKLGDGAPVYTTFTALPCEITPPTPVPFYLLDGYTGAGAAYSVRKLSSSYTGAALRVRRLSDNVEQDIGFIGFDLDTNAMTTFAGPGGNLAISIWYDQTGNGRNMIQTTAASQPYIVNSGVIYLRNGNISIFFNSNNLNVLSSTYFLNQQSSFVVSNMNGTTSTFSQIGLAQSQYFELAGYYSSSWGSFNTPGYGSIITTSPSVVDYGTGALSVTNNTTYLTYLNWNGNLTPRKYRKNGVALANSANTGSNIRTGTISRVFSNGYLSEIIIYPSDQASNVVGIETNINGYYNIYP